MESQEYAIEEAVQQHHWWFNGRRRLLGDLVSRYGKGKKLGLIVDVGCGVGANSSALRPYAETIVGVDPDADAVSFCRNKSYDSVIQSSLEDFSVESLPKKADMVVAMDILEHLPNDALGIAKIVDLLTETGVAIITVPAYQFLFGFQDEVGHHYRRYDKKRLFELMHVAKLKIVDWSYFNSWLFLPIVFVRLAMRVWKPKDIRSESQLNNRWINWLLSKFFNLEIFTIVNGARYPFGISLLVVVKRDFD